MSLVDNGLIEAFILSMVAQLPVLAMFGLGILLAILWWKQHPKVSFITFLGFGLMLITSVAMSAINVWLPLYMRENDLSVKVMSTVYLYLGLTRSVIHAGGLGLLLWAIFMGRGGPTEFLSSVR